jgi:hypothetical protein
MKKNKFLNISVISFLSFSAFAVLLVSLMAIQNPQAVMDLVQVQLPNNDAYSSIRGVYVGVGLTIFIVLLYGILRNQKQGLIFAALFWGSYAFSRILTILLEGPLGGFGSQWLFIETLLCLIALALLFFYKGKPAIK